MKTKLLSAAVLAVMAGTMATSTAQAAPAASAQSVVNIDNLKIYAGATTASPVLDSAQINLTASQTTINTEAHINSPASPGNNTQNSTGANLASSTFVGNLAGAGGTVNAEITGNTAAVPSTFTAQALPFASDFAASGANQIGIPVTNGGASQYLNGATQVGDKLSSASFAGLVDSGSAGANTRTGVTASWAFTGYSGVLTFNFNVTATLGAYLSLNDAFSTKSSFGIVFAVNDVTNGNADVIDTASNIFAAGGQYSFIRTVSNNNPGSGTTFGFSVPAALQNQTFSTLALDATHKYSLTAELTSQANVELRTVPEPGIMALLGVGLLGLGASKRNVSKSSAMTYA